MSLRKLAQSKAAETSKATMKVGFIGQIQLLAGIVPRFAKMDEKPKCFVSYEDGVDETITRAECMKKTKQVTGEDHKDFFPSLWVKVIPDTSITPASRYQGSFLSLETPTKRSPRSLKQHGNFAFDFMSPELDKDAAAGKKSWVHISWVRLTEEYGGDLTLVGDDANDELSILMTRLDNKRAATDLLKALQEGTADMDAMAADLGYDAVTIRNKIREAAGKNKDGKSADLPTLTDIGQTTKQYHMTLAGFTEPKTIEFLKTNLKSSGGDIEATAKTCGADPGDVAIILNQPQYFKDLMATTELEEQDALVKVAADTGLANVADLAKLLDISEAPF